MDKVLIAMSGGVDSSVAAFLMKEQGCECIGATMKLFHNEDIGVSRTKTCCSLEDVEDARLVALRLGSSYVGPIMVVAYSYMALVPIIQPFAIKLVTTKKERAMHMPYNPKHVSRSLRICFPIMVTIIAGFIAPMSVSLVGFLMFGNLLRECGCLERLSQTAQNDLANLITLLLGITISFSMQADQFVNLKTLTIMALGLVAFVFDSIAGVMFAKLLNLFCKNKVNPMVGAAGISAFPMSARVIQKMGQEADCTNHLLMHAVGANVAGQIASVLAGGMILNLVPQLMG